MEIFVSQFRTKVPYKTGCFNAGLKAIVNRHRIKTGFSPLGHKLSESDNLILKSPTASCLSNLVTLVTHAQLLF